MRSLLAILVSVSLLQGASAPQPVTGPAASSSPLDRRSPANTKAEHVCVQTYLRPYDQRDYVLRSRCVAALPCGPATEKKNRCVAQFKSSEGTMMSLAAHETCLTFAAASDGYVCRPHCDGACSPNR